MNDQPAIDRLVTEWLRADAPPRAPQGLLAAALEQAGATGQQRPFGGRPFDAWIGRSPRLHWAIVGAILALLLLGAVAGAGALLRDPAVRPRLPQPSGLARNGLVAYAQGGDIYTVDPVSGISRAVVIGPETDQTPVWSLDGTHFVFERKVIGDTGNGRLFVARADGSGVVAITAAPQSQLASYAFSPDGSEVVYAAGPPANSELWIAKADGSGARRVDVGMSVHGPTYRPPNGAEIIFAGGSADGAGNGIYAVDVASGTLRTIVKPSAGVGLDWVSVAPDGSRVAYSVSTSDPSRNTYSVHVSAIDGSGTVTLPMPQGATFQDGPAWSNDGTRIVVVRGYATRNQDVALAVLPADGSAVGIETHRGLTGCCDTVSAWAPDDTSILMSPEDLFGLTKPQLLLDPLTGVSRPTPWAAIGDPAWQRLAP
jgi:Tol biopolymer transport system component